MCGAAYTPVAVTNEPKIHGVAAAGEAHPSIGVQGGQRGRLSVDPCTEDMEVGADLRGDTSFLSFWYPRRMCVFDIRVVDTDADTYVGTQPHKVLTHHEQCNKVKYLEAFLECRQHFTPLMFLVDSVVGEDTKAATK